MGNQGFKEYDEVLEKYEELLGDTAKRILEDYNKKNGTSFDFYEVVRGNFNVLVKFRFYDCFTKHHIPQ